MRTFGPNQALVTADAADLNVLHIAAGIESNKRDEVLQFILADKTVDVNAVSGPGNERWTAAHIAACWGYSRSLDLLLKHGADPFITDIKGLNVWDIAQVYDNFSCVYVLENRMNRTTADTILIVDDDDDDKHSMISNESANELTHFDKQFGLAFREEKASPVPAPEMVSQSSATVDETICALDDSSLRRRLIEGGESPGPVVSSTRQFYRRRLQRLQSATMAAAPVSQNLVAADTTESQSPLPLLPSHPAEINALVGGNFDFAEGRRLEKELVAFLLPMYASHTSITCSSIPEPVWVRDGCPLSLI